MQPFGRSIPQGLFTNAANLTAESGRAFFRASEGVSQGIRALAGRRAAAEAQDKSLADRRQARAESSKERAADRAESRRRFEIQQGRLADQQAYRQGVASIGILGDREEGLSRVIADFQRMAGQPEGQSPEFKQAFARAQQELARVRENLAAKTREFTGVDVGTGQVRDASTFLQFDIQARQDQAGGPMGLTGEIIQAQLQMEQADKMPGRSAIERSLKERAQLRASNNLAALEERKKQQQKQGERAAKEEAQRAKLEIKRNAYRAAVSYAESKAPEHLHAELLPMLADQVEAGASTVQIERVVDKFVEARTKPPEPTRGEKEAAAIEAAEIKAKAGKAESKISGDDAKAAEAKTEKRNKRRRDMMRDALKAADDVELPGSDDDGNPFAPEEASGPTPEDLRAAAQSAYDQWLAVWGGEATEKEKDAALDAILKKFGI